MGVRQGILPFKCLAQTVSDHIVSTILEVFYGDSDSPLMNKVDNLLTSDVVEVFYKADAEAVKA